MCLVGHLTYSAQLNSQLILSVEEEKCHFSVKVMMMNGFIGIKTNWYTKVKKHLHVSKQLDY